MPQINDIRELAQQNARYVSNSPQDWMSYLDVAARLYRYSFTDTLLIHAQRPDATACAELELWNQKMSRWVNRGAKGIALLDDTGPRTKLRYVFDIADTHLVRGGRTPLLWNLDSHEHEQTILDHLADTYGLSQTDSMNTALLELAQQLTADNLDEAMDGLAYEVADTFLEELDEDNIRVRFRELMTNSIFYTLSRRCGQEPMDVLDDDDFIRIVDFNKLPVLSFLGNAVSEQCEAVLFDIGREMRKIYKKEITQQLEKSVDSLYNTNENFSTLKRETKEATTKGGQENGVDVLPQGRLSVPESGRAGRAADHREVWDAAQNVPEREPQKLVSEYADERQTEPASGADRGSSGEPGGNPAGQPEREVPGTEQGEGPAGMGGAPEQPDGDGRGDRLEGIGVQLTEPTTEQDLSEAEEEIASAFSLPDLPTVEQQIRAIEEPIQARYADEIALDPEVVDEILRTGSNRSKGQLRLIYNFMVEKTPEEYTEFVKNEYGTGGKGFEIDGAKYAVWFDDLGLRIAVGSTAKGGTIVNAFLSWEDVSNRIHELLRQGEYAPQAVLDAARQNALQEHAQTLAYMERDLADGVAEVVFQDTAIFRGGFPEMTDRLAGLLDDTDFLTDLNDRLSALGEAYAEDKDLMRMHFYKPDKVAALFQQFAKTYQNYAAREDFHWNEYKKFITEDEINAFFTRGSNYSDSRLAIYSFFLNHEDKKERADFLKDHYGIGGSSHALCGADDSHEDHDSRGIALERGPYGNPDASVHLNWNQAAGRIDQLIRDSEYLKPADYSRMPAYEREQMAMRVMGFYHHLPNEVDRPYPQDLYHEEGRKALVEKLEAPEQAVELLEQMDNALLSVPLDSEEYERKAESLSILHQYVEGTYTIFPEKKRAVEIAVPEQGQMSIFDFMEQEPQSKEQSTAAAVEKPKKDAPLADEKYSEQTLQPLPLDAANEYNALKERYPDALVGYEQYGNFEFYGEDAKRVSELLGSKLLEKETALGKVEVSGFPREQWVSQAMKLWKQGENVYLSGQQEDGTHAQTKYFRREEYLPVNTIIELDDREFRVDSVDFGNGTVSLQDMTLAKEARYPIFRTEQLEYIRHLYEQADVPMEEAVEITVFTALHNAGVAYEDFSPEQMDVIYSVAEAGGELEELLNPDFPPEQMQLIADVQNRTDAISRAAAEEALEPLTQQPMTPAEVNHARRQHNLPLDSEAETEQPVQPKQEPMNFRITDDDLGAGGPKTKYKANVEAIRVLQTLDAEQRQATAEEQEILSRYVGWGGIPQAFDENNAEWSKEYLDRREDLCATYNRIFNAIRPREYDGSHIRFEGMTPEISLMPHQKNAVAHILYGNNTLLAHCVGAGKTFQMIAAGMESRRLGLSQKNLYVVPNHLTEQWGADFLRLYPNANVLVATKKDFEPSNRKQFCSRIATGDYDAIVIGHSQFERVPLSPERQKAIVERQIDDITLALADARSEDSRSFTVKQMEKTKKTLEAKLQKLNDQTRKDDVVTFEELGVDRLFVDESHFYKNMFLYTKMRNIAGIAQTDAQKSSDMFAKCQYLDELTGGKGVTFATGTPVSNSMVELYTIMRYLQYDTLQKMGLSHFDDWAASFGETVTAIELSPEGTGYRAKTRFARFFNLPELISLFKESADVQTADMLNLPVPQAEYINEVLKPSETQEEMVSSFADRAEAVRNGSVNPRFDNMLKITNDGRKLALDQRLMNEMLPDEPESKVNRCVDNAFKVWEESAPDRGTQLIFCDLSTPKADGTFNVYDDVREKLVAKGVPREEVAFIHEYNTETKKADLFAKVRAGQVRILMGSTPKLGAGTNIQDRLIALHHLDCPWKPSDLEQQEGRILRQGNRNKQVKIYRYVTENTFDSYMWQILENKQKFISQIMTSKSPVRACDDVDDTALSYAEIKALATGNPYIKEKMDLDIQVSKLKLLKANHTSQIYSLESDIARRYPREIAVAQGQIEALKTDMEAAKPLLAQDKDHFSMEISGKVYSERKEAGAAIIEACKALKAAGTEGRIGSYGAFELHSRFDNFDKVFRLSIKGAWNYSMEVGKDPQGNILRVTNALAGIERTLPQVERRLETLEQQLAQAKEEAKRPFVQEAELAEKSARLAELNSLLNMDEKGSEDALGVDEDAAETEVADRPRQPVNYAGRVAERTADNVRKPSVLAQLHAKQAERSAEPQKSQKRKSHDMEL